MSIINIIGDPLFIGATGPIGPTGQTGATGATGASAYYTSELPLAVISPADNDGIKIDNLTNIIQLQYADGISRGVLSNTTQSIGGLKTFVNGLETPTIGNTGGYINVESGTTGINFNYTNCTQFSGGKNGSISIGNNANSGLGSSIPNNIGIGTNTLTNNITGQYLLAIGEDSLFNCTSSTNMGIGVQSGVALTSGIGNTIVGHQAGSTIITDKDNCFYGYQSGFLGTGQNNSCFGTYSGNLGATKNNCTYIGFYSGEKGIGDNHTALGAETLKNMTTATSNIALGYQAGLNIINTSNNILIAEKGNVADSGVIRIGSTGQHVKTHISGIRGTTPTIADGKVVYISSDGQLATVGTLDTPSIKNTGGSFQFATGSTNLDFNNIDCKNFRGGSNAGISIGNNANANVTGSLINSNIGIGTNTLQFNTVGTTITAVGNLALASCTASGNSAYGNQSGFNCTSGAANTFVGSQAGSNITTGSANTMCGSQAGLGHTLTDSNNVAYGYRAKFTGTGNRNCVIGTFASFAGGVANDNAILGYYSAEMLNSDFNTILGSQCGRAMTTGNNNISIGYLSGSAITTTSNNIIIGNSGVLGDAQTIRFGSTQTKNYQAGIRNILPVVDDSTVVNITSTGQLTSRPITNIQLSFTDKFIRAADATIQIGITRSGDLVQGHFNWNNTIQGAITSSAGAGVIQITETLPIEFRPVSVSTICHVIVNQSGSLIDCVLNLTSAGVMSIYPFTGAFTGSSTLLVYSFPFSYNRLF